MKIGGVVQQTSGIEARKNNSLYQVCVRLSKGDILSDKVQKLIHEMIDIMHTCGGVGIAANQVSQNWQLFVINLNPAENVRYQFVKEPLIDKVFINPKILDVSEKLVKFPHGCLSDQGEGSCCGTRRGWVATYEWVEYKALNQNGQAITGWLDGAAAIVFQHEMLHLLGYTYLDVAKQFTTLDELSDQDRQPQHIQINEDVPVMLDKVWSR